jgi:hypothetical protein
MFIERLKRLGIEPELYLDIARRIGENEGYNGEDIVFSDKRDKKLSYRGVDFGASGYNDYIIWLLLWLNGNEQDPFERRRLYHKRATKVARETKDRMSPANLALKIIW